MALVPGRAEAWDTHASLMPWVLKELPPGLAAELTRELPAPCPIQRPARGDERPVQDDATVFQSVARELDLQTKATLRATAPEACRDRKPVTGQGVLASGFVDDPDLGIDDDLPDSTDPRGDRKWMGGSRGPTGKGYRHMYFGGWKASHPIASFQIPTRALGYAPERAELIANKARELLQQGERAWGYRLLAWSMHYLQDLAQPFHSAQVPSLRMVPWSALWAWPPEKGFEALVREATRTISNYHFAYEHYVRAQLRAEDASPFASCLDRANELSKLKYDPATESAGKLAHRVAEQSVAIAGKLGSANVGLFGDRLKKKGIDLPRNQGNPDYGSLMRDPKYKAQREELHEVSCEALANAVEASRLLLQWALK